MRLTGLLSGREALMTESVALATAADNVANLNTTGFKAQRVEFSDLLAGGMGGLFSDSDLEPGNGVQVGDISLLADKQGSIETTDRALDMAISGAGFFSVTNGTDVYYTRAGVFSADKDGNLVNSDGEKLLGFADAAATTATPLNIFSKTSSATPSTKGTLTGNLNVSAPLVTAPSGETNFALINASADTSAPVRIYDSLGESHEISLYFYHTSNLEYTVQAYADSGETGGTPGTATLLGSTTIPFQNNGTQATGATTAITLNGNWSNGAAASSVAVDLSKVTAFSSPTTFESLSVDGNALGSVTKFLVKLDGSVAALTDAGSEIDLGRIALAKFASPNSLQKIGSTKFVETDSSGVAELERANSKGRGQVIGGGLESSNVDPTNEFVDVIKHQRAYQAASQIIQTYSQLLGATTQLA